MARITWSVDDDHGVVFMSYRAGIDVGAIELVCNRHIISQDQENLPR
jgi:hypothetical protein